MNELQTTNDTGLLEKRKQTWAFIGEKIHYLELELQTQAQTAIKNLVKLPEAIKDVKEAEETLSWVKGIQKGIEAKRKETTSKFDPVFERLMAPEKSLNDPIQKYQARIIELKQGQEKIDNEKRKAQDETARVKQFLLTTIDNYHAKFKSWIISKVNEAFLFALNKGIKPGTEVEDYQGRVAFRINKDHFKIELPEIKTFLEDINPLVTEYFLIDPAYYIDLFKSELEKRFFDYETAFINKAAALEQIKKDQETRLQEIEQQRLNKEAAGHLESYSTDLQPASDLKPLRKTYAVDMEETFTNAMKIFAAFMANKEKCFNKTTTKKWFGFNASSAALALSKVKSEDNNFAPSGISFKEVPKL
jgi:hypothetical protein